MVVYQVQAAQYVRSLIQTQTTQDKTVELDGLHFPSSDVSQHFDLLVAKTFSSLGDNTWPADISLARLAVWRTKQLIR